MKEKKTKINLNKDLKEFVKTNVMKKTKVLFVIGILLTIVIVGTFCYSESSFTNELTQVVEKTSILSSLKERIMVIALILLAGWVPYFYIPAIAYVAYVFMLSGDLFMQIYAKGKGVVLMLNFIPALLDIATISVIAALGIYMCKFTTKKYRYAQRTSFSWIDVKMQLYKMRKKEEKYEETVNKKEEKLKKMEENNVKIDYKNLAKVALPVAIINLVVCILQVCIN